MTSSPLICTLQQLNFTRKGDQNALNVPCTKDRSDASGHAPLCAKIITYISYKKTIFCEKQLSLL